jgi:hypothetical protein
MIDPSLPGNAHGTVNERTLRQFGLLCLGFGAGVAGWAGLLHGHWTAAWVSMSVGGLLGLVGLVWPHALRPLFVALMALTLPIGVVISNVILAALFYLLFTPVALIFRLIGRDALGRRRSAVASYWKPYPATAELRRYFRQY